jgi:phytoene dehydrogenase-like protein
LIKTDSIVVGSGISGLTMALILAKCGRSVILIEKAPAIGGSMARFRRDGIPFDVGFHFTGGLEEGGLLSNMLLVLGIADRIEPVFFTEGDAFATYFERESEHYILPYGYENLINRCAEYFSREEGAVRKYFALVREVCENTPSMDLAGGGFSLSSHKEDFVSLKHVLDGLTSSELLKGLLSSSVMCYGVRPSEVSFANHARMVGNAYDSLSYVKDGGDAFVSAFRRKFRELGVDVRTSTQITGIEDISDGRAGRFVLSDGEEIAADNCIFTIHPHEILKVLPLRHFRKAFLNRVRSFESSMGFNAVFATLDNDEACPADGPAFSTVFPHSDVDRALAPDASGRGGLFFSTSVEECFKEKLRPCHMLEPAYADDVARWKDTDKGARPEEYTQYKRERVSGMLDRLYGVRPEFRGRLAVVDSASMLTFRDYLNSPDGSAYGIKQKLGTFNLVGKMHIENLYAAGQSSVLPGVIGAMVSSFLVSKGIIGEEKYGELLSVCNAVK